MALISRRSPRLDSRLRGNDVRSSAVRQRAVYILASQRNGTLYIGVTSDLVKRVWEHKNNIADSFTRKYSIHPLVYFELHGDMTAAITREKQIKKWNRAWKLELIEQSNPTWSDLYPAIL